MRLLLCLTRILFLMRVTSLEHYWVILRERRGQKKTMNDADGQRLNAEAGEMCLASLCSLAKEYDLPMQHVGPKKTGILQTLGSLSTARSV